MRTTITIDDDVVMRAREITGRTELSVLLRLGLERLIASETARRLDALGGSDPSASAGPRRRGANGR